MKIIDLKSLKGNPFAALLVLEEFVQRMEKDGLQCPNARKIINDYNKMSFDEVIKGIELASNGEIVFKNES